MALGKGLNSLIPQQKNRKIIRHETSGGNEGRVWEIPISEITPNSEQPRKNFSHQELEDLISSIKKHGVLQPLIVTEKFDGGYELIAGERRLRASQMSGLVKVPAIVRNVNRQEKLELALIENIQRQNLDSIEEGFAYRRLMDEFGLTQEEVAGQVGKARSTIANMVRLLDLPEKVQKALIDKKISTGQAKALLGIRDEKKLMNIFASMLGEKMTVREVESSIQVNVPTKSRKGSVRRDPNLLASEQLLEEALGTKVYISQKGERGKIEIEYYSHEELKRIIQDLT